jgi:hypothetical protein
VNKYNGVWTGKNWAVVTNVPISFTGNAILTQSYTNAVPYECEQKSNFITDLKETMKR